MDQDQDSRDMLDSLHMPPAPSPPKLNSNDLYKSNNRTQKSSSPIPDRRRRHRSGSRSRSPPSRSYRRSRSHDRDREYSRDRDKHGDRDKNKDRAREYSREKDRSRRHQRRSRSRSRSRSKGRRYSPNSSRGRDRQDKNYIKNKYSRSNTNNSMEYGESSSSTLQPQYPVQSNAFKNDGSFMEMFKKMQEQIPQPESQPTTSALEEKPVAPPPLMVGKRRGGRILKTGIVAKPKSEQQSDQPKDAWSLYMAEVKKYREVCCQEEDNTRPLVK